MFLRLLEPETIAAAGAPDNSGLSVFHLSIKPDLARVSEAALAAERHLASLKVSAEDATSVRIALAEALNNAIQYTCDPSRDVELELSLSGDLLKATVADHTAGFDLPASSELPDPEAESGRGIFIIRQVMDSVTYSRQPDVNRLVMTRRLKRAI